MISKGILIRSTSNSTPLHLSVLDVPLSIALRRERITAGPCLSWFLAPAVEQRAVGS